MWLVVVGVVILLIIIVFLVRRQPLQIDITLDNWDDEDEK